MIKINLAPVSKRSRIPGFKLRLPSFNLGFLFVILYIVVAGGLATYWFTLRGVENRLVAQMERINRELVTLRGVIGQSSNVRAQLAELKARVQAIENLTRTQGRPIKLFDAFADMVPADLWITGMEEKGDKLKVSGTAFSTTAVSDFMQNLRRSGRFKEVDIVVARQDHAKSPKLVTFEVTCRFES